MELLEGEILIGGVEEERSECRYRLASDMIHSDNFACGIRPYARRHGRDDNAGHEE